MSTHNFVIEKGATDVSFDVFAQDSTDGTPLTGMAYGDASLTAFYKKDSVGAITAITLATQTPTGAHSDGGLIELSATSYEGVYRFDPVDTIFATGNDRASIVIRGRTNLQPIVINIDLVDPINVTAGVVEANLVLSGGTATGITNGAAPTGTLSTTQATSDLTGYTASQLNGRTIVFTSGVCDGEATDITAYAVTGGLLTFTALTLAPGNGDTFKIV